MKSLRILLPALLFAACDKPAVAPGLDTCDGGDCTIVAPGVIQGSVVYAGAARGDAVLLLFDMKSLPPPDGTGSSAVAVARVPESVLFAGAPPFSAPFTFTQVPADRSYQIRAFIDAAHEFDPFFDFTQQPRAGDPVGGYGTIGADGQAKLLPIAVASRQVVSGINVALLKTLPYDPPSFQIEGGGLVLDVTMDQPVRMRLRTTRLNVPGASFAKAHFGLELDRGPDGNRRSTGLDGLDDVFPQVFLRQIKTFTETGALVDVDPAQVAIIPCRVISTPVLPALVNLAAGADPVASDVLDALIEPFALKFPELFSLAGIPRGTYQVVVVERSGQVWTVPNSLGNGSASGTPYYASSQSAAVTMGANAVLPSGSVSGRVSFHGDPSTPRGNIIVQAWLDDPTHPPPPLGATPPVRVQIIRAGDLIPDPTGFAANYKVSGLVPGQKYVLLALADIDGNFSPLNLLATPTRGDLLAKLSLTVTGEMTGKDLVLDTQEPLDPPAFELDESVGLAQMPADQAAPVRFGLVAKPVAFPIGAANTSAFTVSLVRDANGKTVDSDGDGLPDVWPRVFLVRLDPNDSSNLTQYRDPNDATRTLTQVVPAAVDPTPFLAALQPQNGANPVSILAGKVTVVARPALLDATARGVPPTRTQLAPGRFKIVLMNQTGQLWQIPNEAGPAALDPAVVCAASAATCPPGTVRTQSQGRYFEVLPPASLPQAGVISGTLNVIGATQFYGAYVFAYDAAYPPPGGYDAHGTPTTGTPVSADFHSFLEFSNGAAAYSLQNLAADRSYLVTAVVDTRGDFALSPQIYAAAPGARTLVGGHLAGGVLAPVTLTAAAPVASGVQVVAGAVLPARPSFQVIDSGLNPVSGDVQVFTQAGAAPGRITLQAKTMLGADVSAVPETGTSFPLSYVGCANGNPLDLDEDNLPDLWPKVALLKISADDPTGLHADPGSVVLPAAIDPVRYAAQLGCTSAPVAADVLDVLVAPAAFQIVNGVPQQLATIPAGRYQILLVSKTGQIWRIPNELQPSLLDPRAAAAAPQQATQGVAASVGAASLPPGSISGLLSFPPGFTTVGNVMIGAWLSTDASPSQGGTGRPVAARVVPRSSVAAALANGLPFTLYGLPTGATYLVGAMMDSGNTFSPVLSYMNAPGINAQIVFNPAGAVAASGTASFSFDPATPKWQFERPLFQLDPTSATTVDTTAAAGTVALVLDSISQPAALAYQYTPLAAGFHGTQQVVFSPLSAGATCAPVAQIDPLSTATMLKAAVPNNRCVRLSDKAVLAAAPSPGPYAITVIERDAASLDWSAWTIPNELGPVSANQSQLLLVK